MKKSIGLGVIHSASATGNNHKLVLFTSAGQTKVFPDLPRAYVIRNSWARRKENNNRSELGERRRMGILALKGTCFTASVRYTGILL
jgi:hypothetical protein